MDANRDESDRIRPEAREYVVNNYEPYNAAVAASLSQHRAHAALLGRQSNLNASKSFLLVVGGLSILGITLALIFWLLKPAAPAHFSSESSGQSRELSELARGEGVTDFEISTSFTVFSTTPTSAGEIVVTGKEYEPDDLSTPSNQYCYMTTSDDVRGAETEIAYVSDGEILLATEDEYLIHEAVPLCQFAEP